MYAVTAPDIDRIYFLDERPDQPGLEIEENVRVEPPEFLKGLGPIWDPGSPRPILCRSRVDPKSYKQFPVGEDFDPAEFEDTGKTFGGVHDGASFDRVLRWKDGMKAIAEIHDETDTDEAWDDVLRNLGVETTREEAKS